MIKKSQLTEIVLLSLLFIEIILKINNIYTDSFLILTMVILNIFWLFRSIFFKEKIKKRVTIEKTLISISLWGVILNICTIPFSSMLLVFSFLLLSIFYVIKFFINWKFYSDWFDRLEPIVLAILFFAFILRFMSWNGAQEFTVSSLAGYIILMLIYAISSTIKIESNGFKKYILPILLIYSTLSILLLAILFRFMLWFWTVSLYIHIVGAIFSALLAIIMASMYLKQASQITKEGRFFLLKTLQRFLIIVSFSIFLFSMSHYQFFRLELGNRPALINSYIDCNYKDEYKQNSSTCKEFRKLSEKVRNNTYQEGEK